MYPWSDRWFFTEHYMAWSTENQPWSCGNSRIAHKQHSPEFRTTCYVPLRNMVLPFWSCWILVQHLILSTIISYWTVCSHCWVLAVLFLGGLDHTWQDALRKLRFMILVRCNISVIRCAIRFGAWTHHLYVPACSSYPVAWPPHA